jgi:hypothetical protein
LASIVEVLKEVFEAAWQYSDPFARIKVDKTYEKAL